MKTATVNELKKELQEVPHARLVELCVRLSKHKQENKELLTYLLFEAHDEQQYVESVKAMMDEEFSQLSTAGLYFVKKNLRKILRITNKHIRYAASKPAEIELLLYFCRKVKTSGIRMRDSVAIMSLYASQLKKIGKLIDGQHEDLQYDYRRELEKLSV
ncbi:hypothetical protein MKQ70_10240 [Chitinophaga sedimenti]|uniref:hypothetical protein n=1 Tax=Chitinophaga sedimenti TaxID=2033606 RepID=UPI002002D769|nr:hypothetical protein [Chitinophaga sedimenti]MCK7555360.1 hypothetical protein [Chitinophaga sedimenti]